MAQAPELSALPALPATGHAYIVKVEADGTMEALDLATIIAIVRFVLSLFGINIPDLPFPFPAQPKS